MTLSHAAAPLPTQGETRQKSFALSSLKLANTDEGEQPGRFTGIASAVGVLDRHGEVIETGAFDQTLAEKGSEFVLLWQHNPSQPIGVINLSTDARGDLVAEGDINLDTQLGREAYALLKQGAIKAMSIGFNIPEGGMKWDEDAKHLRILAVDLWETSLVTFPANPGAVVDGVKADEDALDRIHAAAHGILERHKAGRVLSAANRSKLEAAVEACQAVLDADSPPDAGEKSASDAIGPPQNGCELAGVKTLIAEMSKTLIERASRS